MCIHSPPTLIVCEPLTIETLSLNCVRQISSSTFGCRKKGLPKRNVGTKPIPVSAARFEGTAVRGRFSREYVKCASLSIRDDSVVNQFRLAMLIRAGSPSMPFAEVPYVATSNVSFSLREWLKLYDPDTLLLALATTSTLPSRATVSTGCLIGSDSSCPILALMKLSSATRWQSALPLISASLLCTVGFDTGQAVSPSWLPRFRRSKLPLIPSSARNANALSFLIGPPNVPPHCSRWKPSRFVPSESSPVNSSIRWK